MDNEYYEYFVDDLEKSWHAYQIGDYHISAIGTTYKDLMEEDKTGPCLRNQFFDFKRNNPVPVVLEPEKAGIFHMGNIIHELVQTKYKINHPEVDIEYALMVTLNPGIRIKGSIDIINRYDGYIIDIKSSAPYNMPGSISDMRPQYYSQVMLYAHAYNFFMKSDRMPDVKTLYVLYVNKHNLETKLTMEKYDQKTGMKMWNDFHQRTTYLHTCLEKDEPPIGEPNKYCRYCPDKEGCEEYETYAKEKANSKKR